MKIAFAAALVLLTVSVAEGLATRAWEGAQRRTKASKLRANDRSSWNCSVAHQERIAGAAVVWIKYNCSGMTPLGPNGPMIFNTVEVDLSSDAIFVTPMIANTTHQLAPLNQIAAQDSRIIAGINGGYFYRTDVSTFIDNVCWGKSKAQAEQPPSQAKPDNGVGDTLVMIDGVQGSTNCDCIGYNKPATLVINGTASYITVQNTASPAPPGVKSCLAAGPNLVSHNSSGSFLGIPSDDENSNILEWSSNTAAGLTTLPSGKTLLTLVTADGYDGCMWLDPVCGIDAYNFAFFMKDYLNVTTAMEMDQGGSTTMFIKGRGKDGIVSCSSNKDCTGGPRPLFSGLMVGLK
jgi:hypothetical protein